MEHQCQRAWLSGWLHADDVVIVGDVGLVLWPIGIGGGGERLDVYTR